MMARAFLGLGSNLGDRLASLHSACQRIAALKGTHIVKGSKVYETEPFGVREQPDFLNAVVEIETTLSVEDLHRRLKEIESEMGRVERQKWGPREIDIDLLFFDSQRICTEMLTIPHPGNGKRRFVLEPLAEISPEYVDPETGLTISKLLRRCSDNGSVRTYSEALTLKEEP